MKKNKIAIILVNYNGLIDTIECIESIKNSSIDSSVFVVDNGSKVDETIELKHKHHDIHVIRSEQNLGFAGGNNLAIQKALDSGFEYIMLLNNDTIIDKYMIEHLISTANENTVVLPNMYYFDNPDELWFGGGKIHRILGKVSHLERECINPYKIDFATGCCMLIHRSILEKIGLLSEEYFMYCEDIDFSIRLQQAHINIMMQPKAKLWHKVAKSSPQNGSSFRIYYNTRNRLFLVKKFKSYFSFLTIPYIKLISYIKMIFAKLKGKNEIYKALKEALKSYNKECL